LIRAEAFSLSVPKRLYRNGLAVDGSGQILAFPEKTNSGGITPVAVGRKIMLRVDLHRSKIVPLTILTA
jgi:hypothetical protein